MTKKTIRSPEYRTKLARTMQSQGFRMWSAYPTKSEATASANKLKTGKTSGEYFIRIIQISKAKSYPWPWAVYYKRKGGW